MPAGALAYTYSRGGHALAMPLPHAAQVPLPWVSFSEEELAALQEPFCLMECQQLRGVLEAACQVGALWPPPA